MLQGHSGSVTCLSSRGSNDLLSGSDDGSCRLWDLRTCKSSRRLGGVFGRGGVTSVCFSGAEDHLVYASSPTQVFEFDLRTESVLLNTSTRAFSAGDEEEINEVVVGGPGAGLMAYCDDNGSSYVCTLGSGEVVTQLTGVHDNICSCIAFDGEEQLVTGGFDASLVLWDVASGEDVQTVQVLADGRAASAGGAQLLNPPFVHSMSFSSDGRCLAVGLGDGTVGLLDWSSRTIETRVAAHSAMVAQVHFAAFAPDTLLVSAGNDARVAFWSVDGACIQEADGKAEEDDEAANAVDLPVHEVEVEHKVNWVTTVEGSSTVAIADTSPVIRLVTLPG